MIKPISDLAARLNLRPLRFKPGALAALVFFGILLALGLKVYPDYGVAWDEPTQLELGVQNYRYMVRGGSDLLTLRDRYYGPFFEILLTRLQSKGIQQQVYLSRHLLNFLCFFGGCIAFYFLAKRLFRSSWIALAGMAFLVLSPRIFADAFYNSKDIPFLVFTIFSLLSMLWFLDRPGLPTALIHAAMTAALIAIRLPGLIIPALTLFGLALEIFAHRAHWRRSLGLGLVYLLITAGGVVLTWPALWPNPLAGFGEAFRMMSHFPDTTQMLYMGKMILSTALPWHYIPVWMAITIPPFYLLLFALGLAVTISRLIEGLRAGISTQARNRILILAAFFGPLLVVILLKSVLYDGWRQMYFIYPCLLLIALEGLDWGQAVLRGRLRQPLVGALAVVCLLGLGLIPTAVWMAANHPYQNVYFNRLAGPDLRTIQQNYMLDYWGLSYRRGLEYIVRTDPSAEIPVFVETAAGQANIALLAPQDARRVHVVSDLRQAKYFIGNYYLKVGGYPLKDEIFKVQVGDARLLSVYRLRPEEKD